MPPSVADLADATLAYGADPSARYVAMVNLPTALVETLANASTEGTPPGMQITFGGIGGEGEKQGTLRVGDASYSFTSQPEEHLDLFAEDAAEPCLRFVGGVRQKLTVHQGRESAGAAREQLARSTAQAEEARNARTLKRASCTASSSAAPQPRASKAPKRGPNLPSANLPSAAAGAASRLPTTSPRAASSSSSCAPSAAVAAGASAPRPLAPGASSREAELREWCLHLLALGPQSQAGLQRQLLEAHRHRKLSHAPTDAATARACARIADEGTSGKLLLRADQAARASVAWAHYSSAQRATLRAANLATARAERSASSAVTPAAATPAVAGGGPSKTLPLEGTATNDSAPQVARACERRMASEPAASATPPPTTQSLASSSASFSCSCTSIASTASLATLPPSAGGRVASDESAPPAPLSESILHDGLVVSDTCEYIEYRREFMTRYARYLRLDAELSENTRLFEDLRELARSDEETKEDVARQMCTLWEERKANTKAMAVEYRRLHVELLRLKEGINLFVAEDDATTDEARLLARRHFMDWHPKRGADGATTA